MKKIFTNPEMTIASFSKENIVTLSGVTETKTVYDEVINGSLKIDGKVRKAEEVLAITF